VQNYRAKIPNVKIGDSPMHTLLIGHNPSNSTWETGHYFANPTNKFWKLIDESGLLDSVQHGTNAEIVQINDDMMVANGFGFTDFIETPGNDANAIKMADIIANRDFFIKRIEDYANGINSQLKRLCFVGKKQWKQQFSQSLGKCDHGLQDADLRPSHWPKQINNLDIWVLPSPSGRAVISNSERLKPYLMLSEALNPNNV
jgi:TDG/mug DNA glycosylase family protein